MYPALTGGFLTTAPPGKSTFFFFFKQIGIFYCQNEKAGMYEKERRYIDAAFFKALKFFCNKLVNYKLLENRGYFLISLIYLKSA